MSFANPKSNFFDSPGFVVKAILAFAALIALFSSTVVVDSGTRGVLTTFGDVQKTALRPGLHFKWPFIQGVETMPIRIVKAQTVESASSNDLQVVTTTVAVNFHLDPTRVSKIYRDIGVVDAVYHRIVAPAVSNAVKAVTAQFNADALITQRERVRTAIDQQIRSAVAPYGVLVNAVNITNFKFSPEYDKAIEAKQVAQQRALQANYELAQAKIDAQKQVAVAQAQADANVALANGKAKAILVTAQADAKAMRLKNSSITPRILRLTAIQQWNGQLPSVSGGGTGQGFLPLLDISRFAMGHATTK